MKLNLKRKYYKHTKVGREPVRFHVRQPKGIGTDIDGEVWLDPVLKEDGNIDLREALLKHEIDEIKTWGKGTKASHTLAKSQEPILIRKLGGVSGFWQEIKRRQTQAGGTRTFPTWKMARAFAKQKRKEGYEVEGCAGASTDKQRQFAVIFKKAEEVKLKSPRLHAYESETPSHIVARMGRDHRKPLRSVKDIVSLAELELRRLDISGIKVLVKEIPANMGSHVDAAVRYTRSDGVIKPDQLIIHPMHQYTDKDTLNRKIKHEIEHLKGKQFTTQKVKLVVASKSPHSILNPSQPNVRRPRGRLVSHGVYADKGTRRITRKHRRGWKRIY